MLRGPSRLARSMAETQNRIIEVRRTIAWPTKAPYINSSVIHGATKDSRSRSYSTTCKSSSRCLG